MNGLLLRIRNINMTERCSFGSSVLTCFSFKWEEGVIGVKSARVCQQWHSVASVTDMSPATSSSCRQLALMQLHLAVALRKVGLSFTS